VVIQQVDSSHSSLLVGTNQLRMAESLYLDILLVLAKMEETGHSDTTGQLNQTLENTNSLDSLLVQSIVSKCGLAMS